MVQLNYKQLTADGIPICFTHKLQSKVDFDTFKTDEIKTCYITEMSDGRFGVFTAGYNDGPFYTVIESLNSLHNSFEEIKD